MYAYDRPTMTYTVQLQAAIVDDFGNIVFLTWAMAFKIIMFVLSDNETHLH